MEGRQVSLKLVKKLDVEAINDNKFKGRKTWRNKVDGAEPHSKSSGISDIFPNKT